MVETSRLLSGGPINADGEGSRQEGAENVPNDTGDMDVVAMELSALFDMNRSFPTTINVMHVRVEPSAPWYIQAVPSAVRATGDEEDTVDDTAAVEETCGNAMDAACACDDGEATEGDPVDNANVADGASGEANDDCISDQ